MCVTATRFTFKATYWLLTCFLVEYLFRRSVIYSPIHMIVSSPFEKHFRKLLLICNILWSSNWHSNHAGDTRRANILKGQPTLRYILLVVYLNHAEPSRWNTVEALHNLSPPASSLVWHKTHCMSIRCLCDLWQHIFNAEIVCIWI